MTEQARCANHPERDSTVVCHGCGRPFCDDCVVRFEKLSLCAPCKAKFLVDVDASPRSAPAPVATARPGVAAASARRSESGAEARSAVLPWVGGAIALAFAVLFLFVIVGSLAKDYSGWKDDRTLSDAFERVATIGAALERYHLDTGKYPDDLNALVPKYLGEVPRDPFGGSMHYGKGNAGRRVWSVGPDHKDDHGDPPADIALAVDRPK